MSLQIFVVEFIVDLLVYFLFWFELIFLIDRYLFKLKVPNLLTIPLQALTGLIIISSMIVASMPEHIYKVKRDFDMEVMVTGYKFIWQHQERPDFAQYDPRKK